MSEPRWQQHVCDVCFRVDGNSTQKDCVYCARCEAWICKDDLNRWGRRAQAALRGEAK